MKAREDFEHCAGRLRALTDSHRLLMIDVLFQGEATVSALSSAAGLHITMASHHLSVLLKAGIVKTRRQGRFVYYSLHPDVLLAGEGKLPEKLNLGMCVVDFDSPEISMQLTGRPRAD